MPYIPKKDQDRFDKWLKQFHKETGGIHGSGELNYIITQFCIACLNAGYSYSDLNTIVGALECAKLEFSRRMVNPYEDCKKEVNGDVYPKQPHKSSVVPPRSKNTQPHIPDTIIPPAPLPPVQPKIIIVKVKGDSITSGKLDEIRKLLKEETKFRRV